MFHRKDVRLMWVLLAFSASITVLPAQINVSGISDRNFNYTDSATFRVISEPGYQYDAWLDGQPVPIDVDVLVDKPDYHEVFVRRVQDGTGDETTRLVRFIVKSSNRGSPERGLIDWTPYPLTPSTASEFAGAQLQLVLPPNYPAGLQIPVVARVADGQGRERRANGQASITDYGTHQMKILRGHGSILLPAATDNDPIALNVQLQPFQQTRPITIDLSTTWTAVSGTIPNGTVWPANARIHVTGDVTVNAGSVLTIEAGAVIKLEPRANFFVNGRVIINGTAAQPVVFAATGPVAPEQHTFAWGGFLVRGGAARLDANGAIFFGGGGNDRFRDTGMLGPSHRAEQPVMLLNGGAHVGLTNCAIIDTAGQGGNGLDSTFIMDHCLVQRAITCGEYEGGTVIVNHSAIIEFPADDDNINPAIADADYDAIYFTEGTHILENSLFGFCKDDAIDSGSGGAGTVLVSNCWVEAALHEALAWSGGSRVTWTYDSVLMNCGQGIECGWSTGNNSPLCYAGNLLSLNNSIGARFGDNYDWTYNGLLRVTNSFLLHNYRDIFGRNWDDWAYRVNQMDLRNNFITASNSYHPDNVIWDPAADGWRLAGFMTTPPNAPVGVGLAVWSSPLAMSALAEGAPVRLSTFTTNTVTVDYAFTDASSATLATGTLTFAPGETLKRIYATDFVAPDQSVVHVVLSHPVNGELTGQTNVTFQGSITLPQMSLAGVSAPVLLGRRLQEGTFLFLTQPAAGRVSVDYVFAAEGQPVESGTFVFAPPATWQSIMPQQINPFDYRLLDLTLSHPTGAVWTGVTSVSFTNPPLAMGFATAEAQMNRDTVSNGVPVMLTGPAPAGVGVDYRMESATGVVGSGRLDFVEGESLAVIPAPVGGFGQYDLLRVTLSNPSGAPLGEPATVYLVPPPLLPPVVTNATFVAKGSVWKYQDSGADLGTAWRDNAFNDASWPSGPAQLGFGDGDEAHVINDNDQITTYFRQSFTVADPAAYDQLSLWLLRDDGAVVYINGTEVFRSSNLPALPAAIGYSQLAGNQGDNVVDTATLSASVLQAGVNWIAVEVHQQSATSSDVSFDLELKELPAQNAPLIAKGAVWRYRDAASAAPAGWQDLGFSDAGWPSGPTQLGFGDGDEAHQIADNNQITSYFRHNFTVDDPSAWESLSLWLLRDDGAVVYLNGTEVFRTDNLPAFPAAITYSQLAGNQGDNVVDTATLSPGALVAGDNVIAAEVHQQAPDSSDVSFNLELVGNPKPPTIPQRLYFGQFGGDLVLAWSDPVFVLEQAETLAGPWTPMATASPMILTPTVGQRFYRLHKP